MRYCIHLLLFTALMLGHAASAAASGDSLATPGMELWMNDLEMDIHASARAGHFLAVNQAEGYSASITPAGFEFRDVADAASWSMRFNVIGLGRAGMITAPWSSATVSHAPRDLRFHGGALTVQYLHGAEGMRQNFLVGQRPAGEGLLELKLALEGEMNVRIGGTSASFMDAQGLERFSYSGLRAWDDCGQPLMARMTEDPNCQGNLLIEVDDRCASYPIVIDPVAATASTTLLGPIISSQFGRAVSTAGDLNGDGYSDVVVGAPSGAMGQNNEGIVYVYYGSSAGLSTVPGIVLQSDQVSANFGYSVSTAGDVNGDGYSDLLVGAQTWEDNVAEAQEGAVFVYHGSAAGITSTPAIILQSNVTLTYMGFSVACAGDINNDGYSDIIAGAPYANFPSSLEGAAYVFLGSATGLTNVPHKRLERNQGGAQFGVSVTGAGDVNGDGYSDIAVGAFGYDVVSSDQGIVCIYHGSATGLAAGANPAPNLTINSIGYSSNTGWCVSRAGDVNGDGYSDLAVGDWRGQVAGGPVEEGSVLVYHGSATGLASIPSTILESNQANALYGRSVSTAGDVNGDGYADLIVGAVTASYGQAGEGAAFLYLGSPAGIATTYLYRYEMNLAGGNMGESVQTCGDVNGDGYSDVIVGLKLSDRAVVYHGGPYNVAVTPTATRYSGLNGGRMGSSVANAGDVNGDGYADAVIGSPDASNGQAGEGIVHVHYGSTTGLAALPSVTLEANVAGAQFGYSVSSAGDVNGDGYADVIVGAPLANGTGRAYIYMGSAGGLAAAPAITINGTAASELGYSVCTAGDVNSDGFADVVIGAPGIATAYVHWGGLGGTWAAPQHVFTGTAGTRFGAAVSTAGDVNGSGYSSVIIGAPNYANGQANEGAAYIYHGGPGGLNWVYSTLLEPNLANSLFGTSVAGVGDVKGNGFYDVSVGAPGWASGQAGEGATFVYYGTAAGITAVGMQTIQPNIANVQLGYDVNEAGDVNGDGYADIVIGVPLLTNGQATEGRVWVVEGGPTGIGANTQVESNVAGANMGWSVAGGGDVNGDGYSDIIAGLPSASPTFANEGGWFLYQGNQARALDRRTRQYQANLVSPLSTNSLDYANLAFFGLGHRTRGHIQRNRAKLRWEVVFEGQPFSGAPITNSVGMTAAGAAWTDYGVAGLEIKELITKAPSHLRYKWRLRVEYPLNKMIDGQRFSRWFYGYASGLGDIGILPVELIRFTGKALTEGNDLEWTTGSEWESAGFIVERSVDGEHFAAIGELAAAGESSSATDYTFLDRNAPTGLSYYRLRLIDVSGSEDQSEVISVMRAGGDLALYPNPATETISWKIIDGASRMIIRDAMSQTVIERSIMGATSADVSVLPAGHYTLELLDADGFPLTRGRFIKAQAPIVR
ncbi:MAG: FG-GAP repeat protein [Flavobacteriales bacterium]|nr:FG-GAP repeat protein [Flavobacteriales bacterium]